ncbi:hypothetical protein [Ralstonia syzygii]|uniref:hypothetical protein n=1 Tax=Ralstonia syzygii TaxID=28097 RepID=UPI001E3AA18B|nr:hypothetical protein [Ralstonia syzygii]CAH0444576.1 hypothetical protein LMG10661_01001 [Ralstonia syzygii subsp. syzygii]
MHRRAQLPPQETQPQTKRARGGEPGHDGGGGNNPDFSQSGMEQLMRQQSQMMLTATRLQNEMTVCQTACKLIEQGPKGAKELIS